MGVSLGPLTHLWYSHIIERFIKGTGNKMVFKKILADQLVAGPWFCSSFFFGKFKTEINIILIKIVLWKIKST